MAAMTLTAGIPLLRPPNCTEEGKCVDPDGWQLAYLFISLAFISTGAGGIRPCNIAFGADQFDTNTKKGKSQLESFFDWWYFSFTIALMIALAGVVYVQTNISWVIGFSIPTACLALSITIFLIGRSTYVCRKPQGSVFLDLFKVITAAFCKRKINMKSADGYDCNKGAYYDPADDMEQDEALDSINDDSCRCLNKAALITHPSEIDSQGRAMDSWRLCSMKQVKILKSLARIFPVWIAGIGCFLVMDQQSTFGILQALQMDRSLGKHFTIPPAWMGITSMIALSIWIFIYEQIYIPLAKKFLKRDSRLTMQHRITVGIIMSILCMVAAGVLEIKRRSSALKRGSMNSPIHVAALLPQFALSGLTEAFAAVALMEYFTLKLPQTMRSVAGAIFFLSLSIASYLSYLIVNIMHAVTGAGGGTPWLGGRDLNRNKLDHYYFLVAVLGVGNLFYFTFYAKKFVVPTTGKCVEIGGGVKLEYACRSSVPN
ncbi:Major facilitator superfamily protein [Perilla frutescens var. hirtella]|uniref:Major facilitator superfamily protein n=1 Tax=Perilla frutescens var. hirtella TaxID=608512 RepID=A0AAD4JP74_PERFH|nr:Major facilitator superfamily protein [Perilla frutescens var. hirtella]